jgi:hypothetical protein
MKPVAERLPLNKRHHVVQQGVGAVAALDLARVVEWQDMGMLQSGGDLDFAEKALGTKRGGELRMQHLKGDTASVLEILREVNHGHPAAAYFPLNHVAIGKGTAKLFLNLGHRAMYDGGRKRARERLG